MRLYKLYETHIDKYDPEDIKKINKQLEILKSIFSEFSESQKTYDNEKTRENKENFESMGNLFLKSYDDFIDQLNKIEIKDGKKPNYSFFKLEQPNMIGGNAETVDTNDIQEVNDILNSF